MLLYYYKVKKNQRLEGCKRHVEMVSLTSFFWEVSVCVLNVSRVRFVFCVVWVADGSAKAEPTG